MILSQSDNSFTALSQDVIEHNLYTWVLPRKHFNWEKRCLHGSQGPTCSQHLRLSFWTLKKSSIGGPECKGRHKTKAWTSHFSTSIWPTSCRAPHLCFYTMDKFSVPGIKRKNPQSVSNQFIFVGSFLTKREQLRWAHRCTSLKKRKQKCSRNVTAVLDQGSITTTSQSSVCTDFVFWFFLSVANMS